MICAVIVCKMASFVIFYCCRRRFAWRREIWSPSTTVAFCMRETASSSTEECGSFRFVLFLFGVFYEHFVSFWEHSLCEKLEVLTEKFRKCAQFCGTGAQSFSCVFFFLRGGRRNLLMCKTCTCRYSNRLEYCFFLPFAHLVRIVIARCR